MTRPTFLSPLLTSGGDRRIDIAQGSNVNIYGASPYPRATLGYASSTANDISPEAFAHLEQRLAAMAPDTLHDASVYARNLDTLRARMRAAFGLAADVEIVFAPSGTDLEYVPLALDRRDGGITNLLLGPDEVGSGCVLASSGRYFAEETAILPRTPRGGVLAGMGDVEVIGLPVRDARDQPFSSPEIAQTIAVQADIALAQGRRVVTHVVHGSKTGLVLPGLADLDRLRTAYGDEMLIVVDACQVRLEAHDVRAYLDRGCVVLLTGSKFVGGPPFSGFALVPPSLVPAAPLPQGFATVFRRAEWPAAWRACDNLPLEANPGLMLRLAAAMFEIERFAAIEPERRGMIITQFAQAVRSLSHRLGARLVTPSLSDGGLHRTTLATLDLTTMPGAPDFAVAQRWQRVLAARGIRLGQPVRCVRTANGDWGGTLRVSLSMPLIARFSDLDRQSLVQRLDRDMARIAEVLEAARHPVVA